MYRKLFLLSLMSLSAAVPAFAAGHSSVPPASFLNYHVSTLPQLSQEVTVDPAVRIRLTHHFHTTDAAMIGYIRRNLMLSQLKTTGFYQVACVRSSGQEYWVRSKLPAGTLIFASRVTGQPVLKLACGNPMVSALPPGTPDTDKDSDINGKMNPPQAAQTPTQSQMVALVTPALMPGNTVVDTALASDSFAPSGMQNDIIVSPVVKTEGSLQFANFFSPSSLADFGPEVIGGGLVAALSSIHPGSSLSGNIAPSPVPEASTSISFGLLLVGGAAFLMLRRKQAVKQAE